MYHHIIEYNIMRVIICICSKYPNKRLYTCIRELYKYQISSQHTYEIHVVDSNSDNMMYYDEVAKNFPDVHLHMIKNKNYEYGAWKYIVDLCPAFDVYFCIQDTTIIHREIDLTPISNNTAYTFHHFSGYDCHLEIKPLGLSILSRSSLNYLPFVNRPFKLAQHCSFIVYNSTIKNMFHELTIPPVNKNGSCCYERIFGIYFLSKKIRTINLYNYMNKIHGDRY